MSTPSVDLRQVVLLRLVVGLLGERDAAGWWTSAFLSPTSEAFLQPVFGSSLLAARYQGVLEAARRVHDEHVGVGRSFHPFRLPEVVEQRLFQAARSPSQEITSSLSSDAAARAALSGLAGQTVAPKSGPALLGTTELLGKPWVAEAAALYLAAFEANVRCFPYFAAR